MIANKRRLPTLSLTAVGRALYAGSIATRRRAQRLQAKQQDAKEIQKWEGEGGNPSPASVISGALMVYTPTSTSDKRQGILPWPGKVARTLECPMMLH